MKEGDCLDSITIVLLQKLCSDTDCIEVTQHTLIRFQERGILFRDVLNAIKNGEIIETYPDDYPYPSCLLLGKSERTPLHVVCGVHENKLWIITAYYPSDDKWESDLRTRKVVM